MLPIAFATHRLKSVRRGDVSTKTVRRTGSSKALKEEMYLRRPQRRTGSSKALGIVVENPQRSEDLKRKPARTPR